MNQTHYFYILLTLMFSCQSYKKEQAIPTENSTLTSHDSKFVLQSGDLLFQDSDCGPFCDAIEKVTFGIHGSKFSHVGLVVPNKTGDFIVLEAITTGVVETPLDTFFTRSYDADHHSKVVVGRLKKEHQHLIPKAITFAQTKRGATYDEAFDITNDKYYCSELLYESFKHANQGEPIFQLQPMTYIDPDTEHIFPVWETYFKELQIPVPEGQPGLNPGGMSKSTYIDIVHVYGKPQGYDPENIN